VVVVENEPAIGPDLHAPSTEHPDEALELVRSERPAAALVDTGLEGADAIEVVRALLEESPEVGVVVYARGGDPETLARAVGSGARGFVLDGAPLQELIAAIRDVASGGTYVDARLRPALLARPTTDRLGVLSPREREVLDLLADGLTGEEVAARLSLSPETVRTHVRNAMDKLEAHTRVHAVAIALRQGEI
jgi:DNA-binding NarL/FixJ family response regulator